VTIDTVLVSPPGQTPFRMALHEVTNSQYVEFLTVWARENSSGYYNSQMNSNPRGGITQSGFSRSFTYAVKPNMGDKPVNFVNVNAALAFANWMHNGQGSGNRLVGSTQIPTRSFDDGSYSGTLARLPGATWVVPTLAEWQAAAEGISITTPATADSIGNATNPGVGTVNFANGADWNSLDGNVLTVGSTGNPSSSGTYDQRGNVAEWVIGGPSPLSPFFDVAATGGSYLHNQSNLFGTVGSIIDGTEDSFTGFRLAYLPEPSGVVLAGLGVSLLFPLSWRCRHRRRTKYQCPAIGVISALARGTVSLPETPLRA
jgi:hypothetical protein